MPYIWTFIDKLGTVENGVHVARHLAPATPFSRKMVWLLSALMWMAIEPAAFHREKIVMTRKCVADVRFGRLSRRLGELARRVDKGAVNFDATMDGLQLLIDGKALVSPTVARVAPVNIILVPDFSPAQLIEDANRVVGFAYVTPNLAGWDFYQLCDEKGEVVGRLDVQGRTFEVLTWAPGEYVTTQQVRDHFKELDADGNTGAFIEWVKNKPKGWHISIPSSDEALWRDPESGHLYASFFYRSVGSCELRLYDVDGEWSDDAVFVAFRALTS